VGNILQLRETGYEAQDQQPEAGSFVHFNGPGPPEGKRPIGQENWRTP